MATRILSELVCGSFSKTSRCVKKFNTDTYWGLKFFLCVAAGSNQFWKSCWPREHLSFFLKFLDQTKKGGCPRPPGRGKTYFQREESRGSNDGRVGSSLDFYVSCSLEVAQIELLPTHQKWDQGRCYRQEKLYFCRCFPLYIFPNF